jgi:hypothetical protein
MGDRVVIKVVSEQADQRYLLAIEGHRNGFQPAYLKVSSLQAVWSDMMAIAAGSTI